MKLKDYYDKDCAILLADKFQANGQSFERESFIDYIEENIFGKEFLERQDVFVEAIEKYLPLDFESMIELFFFVLGPELTKTEGMFKEGWWLWPIGRYMEKHGTKDISMSLDFIYELTKRHTGEFAIRPLLEADTILTMERMLVWSKDENVHVRRLASEGLRIRLPWAKKTFSAVDEFDLFVDILSNLRYDSSKFVQKSVGNNLNDLMKERPEKAYEIIEQWKTSNPSKETLWIIKHGMRSLK